MPTSLGAFLTPSDGAVAEFVKVPASRLVRTPSELLSPQVAGIPLAGLTAYQALTHLAELESGQSIFINGGSSSVGRLAIQMAKTRGCRVTTSCSASKMEGLKDLGADEVSQHALLCNVR
jgi:NADPH:quinone reductase-like Zn-dependent oxidoreductase